MSKLLSVVTVVRNRAGDMSMVCTAVGAAVQSACEPFGLRHEILVVDNGSTDGTFEAIEAAMADAEDTRAISLVSDGYPDPAFLAGMDDALGDWVVLFDPELDDLSVLPALVAAAVSGADIALAAPAPGHDRGLGYAMASGAFVAGFLALAGVDLRREGGRYRIMTRRVAAWVSAHEGAAAAQRALPSKGGFRTKVVDGQVGPLLRPDGNASMFRGLVRAADLVASTTTAPLRLAVVASALGAFSSMAYSAYAVAVYALTSKVAPGWTTLSLQMGMMFFLLSLAVGLLSEHVLRISRSPYRRPPYYRAREVRSRMSRDSRLNVVGSGEVSAATAILDDGTGNP